MSISDQNETEPLKPATQTPLGERERACACVTRLSFHQMMQALGATKRRAVQRCYRFYGLVFLAVPIPDTVILRRLTH